MKKEVSWHKFFPLKTPRESQVEILDKAVKAYESGKKFVVLDAATGVGKSAIAVTLSRWFATTKMCGSEINPGGVIVTSQKTLQDQYKREFSRIAKDVRSSSNYECLWSEGVSCGEIIRVSKSTAGWPCRTEGSCNRGEDCPYKIAKEAFVRSSVGITNYSYFLSDVVYTTTSKKRQLLICDECHSLEENLRSFATSRIDDVMCNDIGTKLISENSTDSEIYQWVASVYYPLVSISLDNLSQQLAECKRGKKITAAVKNLSKTYEMIDKHKCQLGRFLDSKSLESNNVIVRSSRDSNRCIEIKPLDVSKIAKELLFSQCEKALLMSATILDFDIFAKSCGLNKDECEFIQVASPFNPKNFGIVYRPIAKMNRNSIIESTPDIVNQVKRILQDHKNEKGIIHTGNYDITRAIASINDSRLLIQSTSSDREKIIKTHLNSKSPTVLVSPAMSEGISLDDELSRFQIICKIPFPYIGDPVIKKLMEASNKWYAWKTALLIIQSIGRGVRSIDDYTKTYILDECFSTFFMNNSELFTDAFSKMTIENIVKGKK